MSHQAIKKTIILWRLALGIALLGGGLALVYLQIFTNVFDTNPLVHRISIGGLVLAGAMTLFGAIAMFTSFSEICVTCRLELESGEILLAKETYPQLKQAVDTAKAEAFLFVRQARRPDGRIMQVASLEYEICPRCRQVARVHGALKEYAERPNAAGEYITQSKTHDVVITGISVPQILQSS